MKIQRNVLVKNFRRKLYLLKVSQMKIFSFSYKMIIKLVYKKEDYQLKILIIII